MLALHFEKLLIHLVLFGEIMFEEAMDEHVRIAAYRGREVSVVVKRQAVVTDVLGGVDGLAHGADGQLLEHVLLLAAVESLHQVVEGMRNLAVVSGLDFITPLACKLCKV